MPGPDIGLRLSVEVAFLKTEDGGRETPVADGYRPVVVVETGDDEITIGLNQLRLASDVAPGDSAVGTLEFDRSVAELANDRLPVGAELSLAEGRKVVACGKVLDTEGVPPRVISDALTDAAARVALGLLSPEVLPDVAVVALAEGLESAALVKLAADNSPKDPRELFATASDELHVPTPNLRDAIERLARKAAVEIVDGGMAPYAGPRQSGI